MAPRQKQTTKATNQDTLSDNRIPDRLLSKIELAAYLHVSTKTVERMLRRGLPGTVVRGHRRFDRSEVMAWLRNQGA